MHGIAHASRCQVKASNKRMEGFNTQIVAYVAVGTDNCEVSTQLRHLRRTNPGSDASNGDLDNVTSR